MRKTITKKAMWTLFGAMALVATTGMPAHAVQFTVDTLIGQIASTKSGEAYEEGKLEAACSCDVTLLSNVDISDAFVLHDDIGSNYIDVAPNQPGYFLLKFGTGNTGNDMFFFKNVGELDKLVWTNAQLIGAGLPDNHLLSISHFAITTNGSVPEPASWLLLGAGLAGVSLFRRRTA